MYKNTELNIFYKFLLHSKTWASLFYIFFLCANNSSKFKLMFLSETKERRYS